MRQHVFHLLTGSMKWLMVAFAFSTCLWLGRHSRPWMMPMIAKYAFYRGHASAPTSHSRGQGPHQLAHTLMINGLPRKRAQFSGRAFNPAASHPQSPSDRDLAGSIRDRRWVATAKHNNKAHRHRSIIACTGTRSRFLRWSMVAPYFLEPTSAKRRALRIGAWTIQPPPALAAGHA